MRANAMGGITYLVPIREEKVADFGLNRELLVKTFGDAPTKGTGNPPAPSGRALSLAGSQMDYERFLMQGVCQD